MCRWVWLIRDNINMQHNQELIDMIQGIGCDIIYLAPYDPRCNPIEAAFSQVKRYCRKHGRSMRARMYREAFVYHALSRVSANNATGYFRSARLLQEKDEEDEALAALAALAVVAVAAV